MTKLSIFSLLAAAILGTSATAFAYDDTAYFKISALKAGTDISSGYRVYPATGYSLPTTQGCAHSDYAEMPDLKVTRKVDGFWVIETSPEANMMNQSLLAAFLGGRKVRLRLDGCGDSGRPKYRIVDLNASH